MLKIDNQVFVLKQDVVEFLKNEVEETAFESVKKLIDDIELVNDEYLNVNHVYTVLDAFYDDDELYDEFNDFMVKFDALPKVKFVKEYDKEVVFKDDIIKRFMDFLEGEQISSSTPDYDIFIRIINSIPVLKLEV